MRKKQVNIGPNPFISIISSKVKNKFYLIILIHVYIRWIKDINIITKILEYKGQCFGD